MLNGLPKMYVNVIEDMNEGASIINIIYNNIALACNRYKVRLGTWNVGILIGGSSELADVLMRRNVNIC